MVNQRRRGVRVLAACSLGGISHLQLLIPFLDQARQVGGETLVVAPPGLEARVREKGHEFLAGGEPPREQVRLVRERIQRAPVHGAWVLGNRELYGRLAATAMLSAMESAIRDWQPDVILREPCEYASAVAGARLGVPVAQVALSPAEVEWGSIKVASLALKEHLDGVTDALRMSPYLTRFPATLDLSPFPHTWRYREPIAPRRGPLPAWWGPCADGPWFT